MLAVEDISFLTLAVAEATKFIGSTAPNPPVGACLARNGRLVAVGAHERAGTDHAEIVAIRRALESAGADAVRGSTLYVTLEPCNHHGRTPPCTDAILRNGISRVVYGALDPNPKVAGGGVAMLAQAGITVEASNSCEHLIGPFKKWILTQKPWVVHKLAFRLDRNGELSMIPEKGDKTFTSLKSLCEAHLERRQSDAILTGRNTVLKDLPLFTVRHVADHPNKKRPLMVLSQSSNELPRDWCSRQANLGFEVILATDIDSALIELGKRGVHRVLVEAGPTLSKIFLEQKLWDERITFLHTPDEDSFFREERI